jgi:hypothetical protein
VPVLNSRISKYQWSGKVLTNTKTSKSTIITDGATEEKTTFKGVRTRSQQTLSSTTKIKTEHYALS